MNIINKDRLLAFRFAPMPEIVRLSPLISFGAKILYNQIISYFWQKGDDVAWPGQQELADKLSISDREIRNCLNELKEVKLIEIKQVGLGKTNNTHLLEPQAKLLGVRKTDNGSYEPIKKSEVRKPKTEVQAGLVSPQITNKATPAVKPIKQPKQRKVSAPFAKGVGGFKPPLVKGDIEGGCITQPPVVIAVKPKPPTTRRTKEELLKLLTELDKKASMKGKDELRSTKDEFKDN